MFCPFVKGECREDCAFRHMARGAVGNMMQPTSHCVLAIVADEFDRYIQNEVQKKEDQNS